MYQHPHPTATVDVLSSTYLLNKKRETSKRAPQKASRSIKKRQDTKHTHHQQEEKRRKNAHSSSSSSRTRTLSLSFALGQITPKKLSVLRLSSQIRHTKIACTAPSPTTNTQRKKSPNQKTTTLSAGNTHTPDTSSTRTTPPSVSRGRISVESPTQDTGPFTLPLSGEGTDRAAGRVDMKRNNLKHTAFAFLSPGACASFSRKQRTFAPFITKDTTTTHRTPQKQSSRISQRPSLWLRVVDSKNPVVNPTKVISIKGFQIHSYCCFSLLSFDKRSRKINFLTP